jgi:hypothetical protein
MVAAEPLMKFNISPPEAVGTVYVTEFFAADSDHMQD